MKMIVYAGGEYTTGDQIAQALMEFSRALAEEEAAQNVEIPIVHQDGTVGTATFLIGPSSQIVAEQVETDHEELVDPETVERLRGLMRGLHPTAITETRSRNDADQRWADDEI
jgi:hypothetical protein